MAGPQEVVTINAKQIDKLLEFGFSPTKATLKFYSDALDYFQVIITLGNGTEALFIGERGKPRIYKNPVYFIQWAKKRKLERIEFDSIELKDVVPRREAQETEEE